MKKKNFTFHAFLRHLQGARFFSLSLTLHLILGATVGSVVLFQAAQPPDAFVASDQSGFISPDQDSGGEEAAAEVAEFEEVSPLPPTENEPPENTLQASAIASLSSVPASFEISGNLPDQTAGSVFGNRQLGTISKATRLEGIPVSDAGITRMTSGGFFGAPNAEGRRGFIGTFYDLKQTQDRKWVDMTPEEYGTIVSDFVRNWNPGKLKRFYRAPAHLIASQVFTPEMPADAAPKAFGAEKEVQPCLWLVWYRARVSPPKTGSYHFVGAGDDIMFVRFNGRTVLDRCWHLRNEEAKAMENYDYGFSLIQDGFAKSRAVHVKEGEYYDIDILIGEQPGGLFYASLLIEEDGIRHDKDSKGNPILPIFRVADELPAADPNTKFPPYTKGGPVWSVQPPKPLAKE